MLDNSNAPRADSTGRIQTECRLPSGSVVKAVDIPSIGVRRNRLNSKEDGLVVPGAQEDRDEENEVVPRRPSQVNFWLWRHRTRYDNATLSTR